jgi:hypothetical protein
MCVLGSITAKANSPGNAAPCLKLWLISFIIVSLCQSSLDARMNEPTAPSALASASVAGPVRQRPFKKISASLEPTKAVYV